MSTLTINHLVSRSLNTFPETTHDNDDRPRFETSPLIATKYTTKPVWRAFQYGMKVLYQYAGRSEIDSTLIAKANLRLLHHTLLGDQSYRQRLADAGHDFSKSVAPAITNLLTIDGLSANLITIQSGCSTIVKAYKQSNRMIMIISGKVTVDSATNSFCNKNESSENKLVQQKPWWGKLGCASNKNIFKQEHIILLDQNELEEKKISALNHHCVLLNVSIAATKNITAH
jgi:hypothetical protein